MIFYSHPDKPLIRHLSEVRDSAIVNLPEHLHTIGEIICMTHDFGKYTTYFQEYLLATKKEPSRLTNHGFISALLGAYIAIKNENKSILPYIAYSSILHHHGNLANPSDDLPRGPRGVDEATDDMKLIEKVNSTYKQLCDMEKNIEDIAVDYEACGLSDDVRDFINHKPIDKVLRTVKRMDFQFNRNNQSLDTYFIHQMLYSALINGDKLSASRTILPPTKHMKYHVLDGIKNKKLASSEVSKLNSLRTQIYNTIQGELENNYTRSKIYSITSPTGTGKTYSGFFAALRLQDLLGEDNKIIYALPFTSIIDQSYESIYELMEQVDSFGSDTGTYIMKHHNLANVEYKVDDNYVNTLKAEMIRETWNSGVIITTFVQLLQTLLSHRNRMLKKFNVMINAIIILDEVQAIDIKYFKLVDKLLNIAVEQLNCKIILMTATKPIILQNAHELLGQYEKYFKAFNRTSLVPKLTKQTVDEFIEAYGEVYRNYSTLIICNTITQSLEIHDKIKGEGIEVLYLSTNLIPLHRQGVIEQVKEKLAHGDTFVLVSTQVVEAGVDVDFDRVIRDIAPLDSIIQSAGRCNRHGKREAGKVYISSMVKDNGTLYGELVYGTTLLTITREILEVNEEIEEEQYLELIETYFKDVNDYIGKDESNGFIRSIERLDFSEEPQGKHAIRQFSLIKNNPDYIDIFVQYDADAVEVFDKLIHALSVQAIETKKELMLEIKKDISKYTLSIPMKYMDRFACNIHMKGYLHYVPIEAVHDIYKIDTGFRRGDEEDFLIL